MALRLCLHCGATFEQEVRYCGRCGWPVPPVVPGPDPRPSPGAPLSRTCSRCGRTTLPFDLFCPQCGAKVAETGPKKWYREPWFKILTFLFLTPVWVVIVLCDPGERESVKGLAVIVLIVYIVIITGVRL